jgi:hypothetical protein
MGAEMSDRERLNQLAACIKPKAQRELEEQTAWRELEARLTALGQAVARASLAAGVREAHREPGQIRFPLGCAVAKYVEITPDGPLSWCDASKKNNDEPFDCAIEDVPHYEPNGDEYPQLPRGLGFGTDERRRRLEEEFERQLASHMSEHGLSI